MIDILSQLPKSPRGYGPFYAALCELVPLGPISSEEDRNIALAMVVTLGQILEAGRLQQEEEVAAAASYLMTLGYFVAEFESRVFKPGPVKGADILRELIDRHNLNEGSLQDEIGPQTLVSKILNGEHQLTREHIEKLAGRFNVSPVVFFDRP